ncbi:spt3 [Diaporthe amygdali]|uniref:spt3 n=1 Tax=Phomopsis amygdali TaxID=1214568 RepID=UPI0022FE9FB6|nr:spt3 [Diaporthe amygdali]KAJ0121897.1 spt3 [Diaporthe amygdali]
MIVKEGAVSIKMKQGLVMRSSRLYTRRYSFAYNSSEPKFKQEIQQMMYIAGETQDPSTETIALVENIIHDQVVRLLTTASDLARRRGSPVFSKDDLIFQIRHDASRVARLRNLLVWNTVRRKAKDAEEVEDAGNDGGEVMADDDAEDQDEESAARDSRLPVIALPWDIPSYFSEAAPAPSEGEEPDEAATEAKLERLRRASERTRNMTVAEYATWSEYRHASFTRRKVKRFRAWSGLGVIAEHKKNDDVLDIIGLITSEMVHKLTMVAMRIQKEEMLRLENATRLSSPAKPTAPVGLFAQPTEARKAVEPRHVRQAFQRIHAKL